MLYNLFIMANHQEQVEDILAGLESAGEESRIEVKPELSPLAEVWKEKKLELKTEAKRGAAVEEPPPVQPSAKAAPVKVLPKGVFYEQVEDILEEDLGEAFVKMSPEEQDEFKKAGEETASKIAQLLEAAKVKTRKIFDLIVKWLRIIPGINRFFLEQEAKIKADKILRLKIRK